MIDWMDRWNGNVFLFLLFFFIDFGQLNFVWSALFLFTIYFLLLIRCSLVRARPSSSPCVQALRKRVKSLRSNDIFTFQRFFLLYLLGYQFILSLPVRREDGFGNRSIEERKRETQGEREKRSLKS